MQWWYSKYSTWPPQSYEEFAKDICSSKKFEAWKIEQDELEALMASSRPPSYGEACALIYEMYGKRSGKAGLRAMVDKNNYYIGHIPVLKAILPDADFIHLVRDGRDVACSYKSLRDLQTDSPYRPDLPHSIDMIAQEWTRNNQLIEDQLSDYSGRVHLVRYEDLMFSKVETLNAILDFMGLQWDESLNRHDENNDEPASTLAWKQLTNQPFTPKRVGRYKKDLSQDEIKTFESIAGEMLRRYRYLD